MAAVESKGIKYFDVPELVTGMGVKTSTVRRWIKLGRLKAHKVGRKYYVQDADLKAFIESAPSPAADRRAQRMA